MSYTWLVSVMVDRCGEMVVSMSLGVVEDGWEQWQWWQLKQ